jgi:hypothetical protein
LSFCPGTTFFIHKFINKRVKRPRLRTINGVLFLIYKLIFRNTYLTFELWPKFFSKEFDNEHFDLPGLGIDGNLRDASSVIVEMIYRFNSRSVIQIDEWKNKIELPENYLSMQIRRGDKINEVKYVEEDLYFEFANQISNCRTVFILTDDFSIIENVRKNYKDWRILSLTEEFERGYFHDDFVKLPKHYKREKLLKLFASLEIIRNSSLFICTFTANTALFAGMSMPYHKIFSVQKKEWFQFSKDDILSQLT